MTFFFDNQMSERIVDGLKAFGENVVHLREEFSGSAKDVEWLPSVGQNGWILISRDKKLLKNPAEKELFIKYQVGGILLDAKGLSICDQVEQIVRNWKTIKRLSSSTKKPFAYRFYSKGKVFKKLDLDRI